MKTIVWLICLCCPQLLWAQHEGVVPLDFNPHVKASNEKRSVYSTYRTTAATLPFFEDFTNYDALPDPARWIDRQVYINNTMGVNPISRGVATFDALNQYGKPYDTITRSALLYADSLTSVPIDLSGYTVGDSLYLSFFFQAQGNGFIPESKDSLLLFFYKKSGTVHWVNVWGTADTLLRPFRQVMIPLSNPEYFDTGFRFRFVNKASLGTTDDIWNIDYIRLDAHRAFDDTLINDIAFNYDPGYLLNDYTAMPYRQFMANPSKERGVNMITKVYNNYQIDQTVSNYGYIATETSSGIALASGSGTGLYVPTRDTETISFPVYTATVPVVGTYDRVVFEQKFYMQTGDIPERKMNDTIIRQQIFDNYLAYDDGTAEMSYYLKLSTTLPGKTAIEYHLNQPDTMRGMAIYFGRQVPSASYKYISLVVYRSIAYGSGKDSILYQEDNINPKYVDTVNHFWVYRFKKSVPLEAGTFFAGVIQPALSGSDSLYIGLDRNRVGGDHFYYNVLNYWAASGIRGAAMIRPILGQPISGTDIPEMALGETAIYPNPATDQVTIKVGGGSVTGDYVMSDAAGRVVQMGKVYGKETSLDISSLTKGFYILRIYADGFVFKPQSFIKQ